MAVLTTAETARAAPLGPARGTPIGAVLVLTADTAMGLAIVRSLGRGGLRVVVGTSARDGVGAASRYAAAAVRVGPRDADALAATVLDAADRLGVTDVVATSEDLLGALNAARPRLEPRVRLHFPPSDVLALALDKDRTLEIAERCGVPVPRTVWPRGREDHARCLALRFPVVLKPARRGPGTPAALAFKCERVDDAAALARRLDGFAAAGAYPLVQEWVPGRGVGVEALCLGGEPVLLFQHRRVREDPPEGGVSVVCESVPLDPALAAHATRLLRAMRWDGVAMVEFRRDDATGDAVLMEVNGRFWGSLPLALHAGADFPLRLVRRDASAAPPYRAGVRCREPWGDTKWLAAVLRRGGRSRAGAAAAYVAGFAPWVRGYLFAADDPWPAVHGWAWRVRNGLGALLGRRRS